MSNQKFLVQINYKSGHRVEMWFDEFKVDYKQTHVTSVEYTVSSNLVKPMFLGDVTQIESIFQIAVAERDE